LLERLRKYEVAVLLFAKNPNVAFTNNRSERDLRMAKVKQKVSGCFRSAQYAHAYCRISSYLQTMTNKDINPMHVPFRWHWRGVLQERASSYKNILSKSNFLIKNRVLVFNDSNLRWICS